MTDDERIRDALAELRTQDARHAPSFDAVRRWEAPNRTPMMRSPMLRLAAAGAIITLGAFAYSAMRQPASLTIPDDVAALSAWRAPSDALLPPRNGYRSTTNMLGRSMIEFDSLSTVVLP